MRYISLFSGIEAASVAWEPLHFTPIAFSEIDPFCSKLLEERFPNVPNLGDISEVDWRPYRGKVDIVVGGSPCQAFSVAGPRTGLMDERSALMLEYIRTVRETKPTWCLWENVPGVLSQDKGRAFATLQRELEDCGYAMAWRVLDAQFFGVAQRRRRVFLVGHSDPRCAAAVLFERESLFGDFASSREARAGFAAAAQTRPGEASGNSSLTSGSNVSTTNTNNALLDLYENHGKDARIKGPMSTCPTITALYGTGGNNTPLVHKRNPNCVSYALVGNIIGRKPENGGNGSGFSEELCYTLTAMDNHAVCHTLMDGSAPDYTDNKEASTLILNDHGGSYINVAYDVAPTLRANTHGHEPIVMGSGSRNAEILEGLCPTQTARQHKDPPVLFESYAESSFSHFKEGEVGTLRASGGCLGGGSETLMKSAFGVRRLTPLECERLQGFPDNWTRIEWNGKPPEKCPDSRRYKALGNSMAVPVMRWIGQRMQLVDRLSKSQDKWM